MESYNHRAVAVPLAELMLTLAIRFSMKFASYACIICYSVRLSDKNVSTRANTIILKPGFSYNGYVLNAGGQ